MKPNQRLRRERELHGWSQARVALEVGTDPATVSRWERGLSFPYPYFREKLCALFEKNAEELGLVHDAGEGGNHVSSALGQPVLPALPETIHDPTIPLPSTISVGLVGRDALLQQLKQRLCSGANIVLTALNGLPGVGKTSLAVQLAHDSEVRTHFEAGVLWAGLGPKPNVLAHLSRWGALLGVASNELAKSGSVLSWGEAIRAAIGTRPMLLVIDDAWKLDDALALKVGGPSCALLVTTRFPHIALYFAGDDATMVSELSEDEGIVLLERLTPGLDMVEEEALRQLVRSVGGLPLALTLVGKYLRVQAHSHQPRRVFAALQRLQNVQERLLLSEPYALVERHTSLAPNETSVSLKSVIEVSDLTLDARAQLALRALSVFPAKPNSFSEDAAVAVCDLPLEVLDTLTDAGLLESRGPDRYTLHQSIADYALLNLNETAPYQRLVSYYVDYILQHAQEYNALATEGSNILAALHIANERGMQSELVHGVTALAPFLLARAQYGLAEDLLQLAHNAALALESGADISLTLLYLGKTMEWLGEYERAEAYLREGLDRARKAGCLAGTSSMLAGLGEIARRRGNQVPATALYQEALALARKIENHEYMCSSLAALGRLYWEQGDYTLADQYLQDGLVLARKTSQQETMVSLLTILGLLNFERGNYAQGEGYIQEALILTKQRGLPADTCRLLINFGKACIEQADYERASGYLRDGLALARQVGYREMICLGLKNHIELINGRGDYEPAPAYFEEALEWARQINNHWYISACYIAWGELHLARHLYDEAGAAFQQVLVYTQEASQELGTRKLLAESRFGLARIAAIQGNYAEARHLGAACLTFFEERGHYRTNEVRAWFDTLPTAGDV